MRIRFLPPRSMQTQRSFFDTWNLDRCKRQLPKKICFTKDSCFFIRFRVESLLFLLKPMPAGHQWHDMYPQQVYLLYLRSSVCNCGNHLSYYIPSYIIFSLSLLQSLNIQICLSCHLCVIKSHLSAMDCSDQSYPRNDEQVSYFSQNCVSLYLSFAFILGLSAMSCVK